MEPDSPTERNRPRVGAAPPQVLSRCGYPVTEQEAAPEAAVPVQVVREIPLTSIVTLALDEPAQHWFNAQREAYFPPALNHIPAHVTLFHNLPGNAATRYALHAAATAQAPFRLQVDGLKSMGRGVLYTLASPELHALHRRLAAEFTAFLIPQDKQPLRPHVVVQNKVEPAEAKALLAELQAGFQPRAVEGLGLHWWEYLGGPWRLLDTFPFSAAATVPE
jgi:2'-5' RNA ligase